MNILSPDELAGLNNDLDGLISSTSPGTPTANKFFQKFCSWRKRAA